MECDRDSGAAERRGVCAVRGGTETVPGCDDRTGDVVKADWIEAFLRGAPEVDGVEVARLRSAIYRLAA